LNSRESGPAAPTLEVVNFDWWLATVIAQVCLDHAARTRPPVRVAVDVRVPGLFVSRENGADSK
jgi:hypothetical protein